MRRKRTDSFCDISVRGTLPPGSGTVAQWYESAEVRPVIEMNERITPQQKYT